MSKATLAARQNETVLMEVSRELYEFLAETIEDLGIGSVTRGFDELDQEEVAVFKVRSRLIVKKIVGGWD